MNARKLLPEREELAVPAADIPGKAQLPDIYYLVLDAYGRADYLNEHYGLDNSGFLQFLEGQGFYVARQSTTNYPITLVSIASTLNSMYWDEMGERLGEFPDRRFMREMMQQSRVVEALRSAGYRIVAFDTEYSEASIGGTDIVVGEWWYPNAFQVAWLQMTPLPDVLAALGKPTLYDLHRVRVTDPIDQLPEVARLPGPKFVYFHTFFGHPPFVFGPSGERISSSSTYSWDDGDKYGEGAEGEREQYIEAYRNQVRYLNGKLEAAIQQILAQSERTPVIVLQGDHGPGSRFSLTSLEETDVPERYSIFHALLLPESGRDLLYPSITPVNTFRVVLNACLNADLELLEDRSYYNPFLQPYNYVTVNEAQSLREERQLASEESPGAALARDLSQ